MFCIHKFRWRNIKWQSYDQAVTGQDEEIQVSVLIVGGSLVGLSTALLLARHGVESLVVERHSGAAIHPRAGISTCARDAARPLGVGLDAYQVAGGEAGEQAAGELADAGSGFCAAYGISPDGAVLVRPDGFVAWRAADGASATAEGMTGILSRVLCRANAQLASV
jgi:flavin-dependent dehydrogenase